MAAQTVTASMATQISVSETMSQALSNSVPATGQIVPSFAYVNGNSATALGINQYLARGVTTVTLNASANTTIVLTNTTDDIGRTVAFANGVRGIAVYATSRTTGDFLTIGAAATNTWTGLISVNTATVKVFDYFQVSVASTDKYAVSAGNDQLKITNGGSNPITFKYVILGNF